MLMDAHLPTVTISKQICLINFNLFDNNKLHYIVQESP